MKSNYDKIADKKLLLAMVLGFFSMAASFVAGQNDQKAKDEEKIEILEKDLDRAERKRRYDHQEYDDF